MATRLEIVISAVDQASGVISRIEGNTRGMADQVAGIAGRAALALGAVGVAAGSLTAVTGVKFNLMREQAQIAFETMLGSGERAKSFLDELADFAKRSPFQFSELIPAAQRLLALGFSAEEVIPVLTNVGDAAAALGANKETIDRITLALGQMKAKGTVQAQEMKQLAEAGIPAWQMLAQALGVDVATAMKMVEDRAVDADTGIAALTSGMNERFAGMMERQSRTVRGLFSNLKDVFAQASGTVMMPFFELAREGLEELVKLTSSPEFEEGLQNFADGMRAFIADAGPKLVALLKTEVIPRVVSFARFIERDVVPAAMEMARFFKSDVAPALKEIGEVVEQKLGPPLRELFKHIDENKAALIALGVILGLVALGFAILLAPIVILTVKVGLLIAAALLLAAVATHIVHNWGAIKSFFTTDIPAAVDGLLQKFLEIPVIGAVFEDTFNQVRALTELYMGVIVAVAQFGLDSIRNYFLFWKALFSGDWGGAWNAVKDQAGAVWTLLSTLFGLALDAIGAMLGSKLEMLTSIGSTIGNVIAGGFSGAVEGVKSGIVGGLNWIIDRLNDFLSSVDKFVGPFRGVLGKAGIDIPDIPDIPHIGGAALPAQGSMGEIGGYQLGGIVRHALQLLGERGPELAALPVGTRVFDARQTQALLAGAIGGGDTVIHLHIGQLGAGVTRAHVRELYDLFEKEARDRRRRGG